MRKRDLRRLGAGRIGTNPAPARRSGFQHGGSILTPKFFGGIVQDLSIPDELRMET